MGWLVSPDVPAHSREDKTMNYTKENAGDLTLEQIEKKVAEDYEKRSMNMITGLFGGGSIARHNPEELDRYTYPAGFISAREQQTR